MHTIIPDHTQAVVIRFDVDGRKFLPVLAWRLDRNRFDDTLPICPEAIENAYVYCLRTRVAHKPGGSGNEYHCYDYTFINRDGLDSYYGEHFADFSAACDHARRLLKEKAAKPAAVVAVSQS